uniref:Uncharacterized protein n=1 Tax=Xenopus tropicalis TaxID=8364 RepID=A0A1B8XSU2_XENTR
MGRDACAAIEHGFRIRMAERLRNCPSVMGGGKRYFCRSVPVPARDPRSRPEGWHLKAWAVPRVQRCGMCRRLAFFCPSAGHYRPLLQPRDWAVMGREGGAGHYRPLLQP